MPLWRGENVPVRVMKLSSRVRYIPAGKKKRSPAILVHTVVVNMAFFNQVSGKKVFRKSKVIMAITLRPYTSCILKHLHLMRTWPVKGSQATVVTAVGISMVFFNQPFCKYELSPPEVNVTKYCIIRVLLTLGAHVRGLQYSLCVCVCVRRLLAPYHTYTAFWTQM